MCRGGTHTGRMLILAGVLSSLGACGTGDIKVPQGLGPTPTPDGGTPRSDDMQLARPKANPAEAMVDIVTGPFLAPISEGSALNVPTLLLSGIEDEKADYVQVARCMAGTVLKTSTGVAVGDIPKESALRLDQLKWIWINQVWANTARCRIVGGTSGRIAHDRFQDLSAPKGEFFYVINPCLTEDHSKEKETCSYNLSVSDAISHTNSLKSSFVAIAEKLARSEGVLAGLYSQLYYSAQAIRNQQEACENNHAVSQATQNFWKGLVSVTLSGVGAAVGSAVSGGAGALQGFKTGLGLAVNFFSKQPETPLVCPLVDQHIAVAKEASGKTEAALADVLALRKQMAEVESEYAQLESQTP